MAVPLTLLSVPAQTPYIQYIATSSQTVFPYPFEITQDSDLVCLINGVQQATDSGYTLSGQGATGGGNLTFTLGQTAGAIITLYRNISIARITQLAQNGTFFSANFNNEYNRIYLIMQQLEQQIANCLQIPNTNSPQLASYELAAAAYANKYLAFDANGNPTPAILTSSGSLTAGIITGLTGAQTAAETAAGATVVNTAYPVGCVDRYGTNTTPGTTSMTAAFQAAVNLARKGGPDVTWGATAPYNLDNVIDCTFGTGAQQYGITFRQIGTPGVNLPTSTAGGLLITHNKYTCFDLTGCAFFAFYDLTAVTNSSNYPQTMFLTARSVGASNESNFPRFFNTKVLGYFSVGILYNYASEDGLYVGNIWENYATDAGAGCVIISATNLWQGTAAFMSSTFVTISTGSKSCIGHTFISGDYSCNAASTTSDVFYLEGGVEHLRLSDGWFCCSNSNGTTHGRSYVYMDSTNGFAANCKFVGMHGENSTTLPSYGIDLGTTAGTSVNWMVDGCYFATNTYAINSPGASVLLSTWYVRGITELATKGINIAGTLEDSSFDYEGTIVIGTSLRSEIHTSNANLTVTTNTNDLIIDRGSGALTLTGAVTSGGVVTGGTLVSTGNVTATAGLGLRGNAAAAQSTGWGTPVGGSVIDNYNITDTGGSSSNTNKAVAQIIAVLKLNGLFGA